MRRDTDETSGLKSRYGRLMQVEHRISFDVVTIYDDTLAIFVLTDIGIEY